MRILLLVASFAALGACKAEMSSAEKARQDERDIAQVEAAQKIKPPPQALHPQPITEADITANQLSGAGCALIPSGTADDLPVLLSDRSRAVLKLDGRMLKLAADPGSTELPLDSRAHYVGKRFALQIEKASGEGTIVADELTRWSANITIRDAWDQIVYRTDGALECGA